LARREKTRDRYGWPEIRAYVGFSGGQCGRAWGGFGKRQFEGCRQFCNSALSGRGNGAGSEWVGRVSKRPRRALVVGHVPRFAPVEKTNPLGMVDFVDEEYRKNSFRQGKMQPFGIMDATWPSFRAKTGKCRTGRSGVPPTFRPLEGPNHKCHQRHVRKRSTWLSRVGKSFARRQWGKKLWICARNSQQTHQTSLFENLARTASRVPFSNTKVIYFDQSPAATRGRCFLPSWRRFRCSAANCSIFDGRYHQEPQKPALGVPHYLAASVRRGPRTCPKCDRSSVYFFGEGSEGILEERLAQGVSRRADCHGSDRDGPVPHKIRQYQENAGRVCRAVRGHSCVTQSFAKGHDLQRVSPLVRGGVIRRILSLTLPTSAPPSATVSGS